MSLLCERQWFCVLFGRSSVARKMLSCYGISPVLGASILLLSCLGPFSKISLNLTPKKEQNQEIHLSFVCVLDRPCYVGLAGLIAHYVAQMSLNSQKSSCFSLSSPGIIDIHLYTQNQLSFWFSLLIFLEQHLCVAGDCKFSPKLQLPKTIHSHIPYIFFKYLSFPNVRSAQDNWWSLKAHVWTQSESQGRFSVSGILSVIIDHEEIFRGQESCKSTQTGERALELLHFCEVLFQYVSFALVE